MPGINLLTSRFFEASGNEYHHDQLTVKEWYQTNAVQLSTQTPENYPVQQKDSVFIEGYIYNDEHRSAIPELTQLLQNNAFEQAAQLAGKWDGEFVIIYRDDAADKLYVVNDGWGRLPFYYWSDANDFILTRNISLITHLASPEPNPESLAVSLLFGMNLGEETIWKNTLKISPNSIVEIDTKEGTVEIRRFFKLKEVSGTDSIDAKKDQIKTVFEASLKDRLKTIPNPTLSLSGGLDSRLIAAALKDGGFEIPCITYNRKNGADHLDFDSSKRITDQLNSEASHEVISLEAPVFEDAKELLQFKQGLNYLSMSYILPYYRLHKERKITTITGDGGGKFFVDLYPLRDLKSMKDLLEYLLRYNAFCSIKIAASVAGIAESSLKNKLVNYFKSYPFEDYNDIYTYFLIREAGINWAFEGEDRNRQYIWSTTPFYNPQLIELCLSIPQRSKAYGNLYNYLYQQFPGNLQNVSNPNWKEVVENSEKVKRIHDRQKLKSKIPRFLLERKKGIPIDAFVFSKELQELIDTTQHPHIHTEHLKSKNSMNFYWQLLTLLMLDSSSN